jgi:hypothetical protein
MLKYKNTTNYIQKRIKMKALKVILSIVAVSLLNATDYSPSDFEIAKKYLKENINLAIAALERILIYQPDNDKAKFELFKIYKRLNNMKLAQKYLSEIKHPTPEMQKEIDKFQTKLKFDLTLLVGASLDSNINNDTDATSWNIYQNNTKKTIYNNKDKQFGFAIYELLKIDPVYTKEFEIHNSLTLFNKNNVANNNQDIQVISYTPSINHTYKQFNLKHYLNYTYVRYGNDDYNHKFGIGENIQFDFRDYTSISDIKIDYTHYLLSTINNDDYYALTLSSKLIKHIKSINLFANINLKGTKKSKSSDNATQYKQAGIGAGIDWSISKYILNLQTNYTIKKYIDENLLFKTYQFDKKLDSELSILKKGKYLDYQTKLEIINNQSNIKPYSYNKWILSINIIKQFKGL